MNSSCRLVRLGFVAFASLVPCGFAGAQGDPSIFPAPVHELSFGPDKFTVPEALLGDVTGDGLPDAVVVLRSSFGSGGGFAVHRGDAQGGFGAVTDYGFGCCSAILPWSIVLADIDADGRLDVVGSTYDAFGGVGESVGVLRGNAQGTLDPAVYYPVTGFGDVAVGDVTGDGRPDVVVHTSTSVCVLAGNAQGTLDPENCQPAGGTGGGVAIGDVTADGRNDVVVTQYEGETVCVLAGNAQGSLEAPVCLASGGTYPRPPILADMDLDGTLDVVVAHLNGSVCVLDGGIGGLGSAICYPSGTAIWDVEVRDVTGDGRPDVLVAGGMSVDQDVGQMCVLRNLPGGGLGGPECHIPGTVRPGSIALADLAADGRLDAVLASGVTLDLCLLGLDGAGGVDRAANHPTAGYGPPVIGDVTGDGRPDVVQARASDARVCVLAGNAQGDLDPSVSYPAGGGNPGAAAIGDVTGDGREDVVVRTDVGVCVLAANAQGTLEPPVPYVGSYVDVAVGDVTGDGRQDVVASRISDVCVLAGNAQGTLNPPLCYAGTPGKLALADVTGDGRLDVVVVDLAYNAGRACLRAGNAQGGLDAPFCRDLGPGQAIAVAVGDVSGDGRPDVLVTMQQGSGLAVLHGNAQGTLDAPGFLPNGVDPLDLELGDVDADGLLDALEVGFTQDSDASLAGSYVTVRKGTPQGSLGAQRRYSSGGRNATSLALGDLDGDGRGDAVVATTFPDPGPDAVGVAVLDNRNPSLGTPSCFGGATCPCGNAGAGQRGCQNSSSTGGARLIGNGVASLADDTVRLFASGEKPTALTIFLQGDTAIPATNFGDGLRCAGGALKRLYVKSASQGAASAPLPGDLSISARSAAVGDPLSAGDARVYQTYYRDPSPGFCPEPTGSTFNSSNALTLIWSQ